MDLELLDKADKQFKSALFISAAHNYAKAGDKNNADECMRLESLFNSKYYKKSAEALHSSYVNDKIDYLDYHNQMKSLFKQHYYGK